MLYVIREYDKECYGRHAVASTKCVESLLSFLYPEYPIGNALYPDGHTIEYTHNGASIYMCGMCSSTQDIATTLIEQDLLEEWGMVISMEQSSGRGQYRNAWTSLPGNVFATIRLPKTELCCKPYFSTLLGSICANYLRSLGYNAYSKWVNDIIIDSKKVAGILIEENSTACICGVGINVLSHPPTQSLRKGSLCEATHLVEHGVCRYSIGGLLVSLREYLYNNIIVFETMSSKEHNAYIETLLAYLGKAITLEDEGASYSGIFRGIAQDGALLLEINGEYVTYISGRITAVHAL